MRVTIQKDRLLTLIQRASRPVPSRTTMDCLKGCLIRARENLSVKGMNFDWCVEAYAEADIHEQGEVLVTAKLLLDVVKTLEQRVTLCTKGNELYITSNDSEVVLNTMPVKSYPEDVKTGTGVSFTVDKNTFEDMVKLGNACSARSDLRPLCAGAYIDLTGDELNVVSTDQFALSKFTIRHNSAPISVIVPSGVLDEVLKMAEQEVSIDITQEHIKFAGDDFLCVSNLLQGQYYAYQNIIPRGYDTRVVVSKKNLYDSSLRASIMSSEESRGMQIIINDKLRIKASDSSKGNMEEIIESEITGPKLEVEVQHKYILQALSRLDTEHVELLFTSNLRPVVIKALDDDKAIFIVMPLMTKKGG